MLSTQHLLPGVNLWRQNEDVMNSVFENLLFHAGSLSLSASYTTAIQGEIYDVKGIEEELIISS